MPTFDRPASLAEHTNSVCHFMYWCDYRFNRFMRMIFIFPVRVIQLSLLGFAFEFSNRQVSTVVLALQRADIVVEAKRNLTACIHPLELVLVVRTYLFQQSAHGVMEGDFVVDMYFVFIDFLDKLMEQTEKFRFVAGSVLIET